MPPSSDHLGDPRSCSGHILMFPYTNAQPACCRQPFVRLAVPGEVGSELMGPPLAVPRRNSRIYRAGMPEAAVNEYLNLCSDETDITTTPGHAEQWQLDSIPHPQSTGLSAQFHLGTGVLHLLAGHPPRGDVVSRRLILHSLPPHLWLNHRAPSLSSTNSRSTSVNQNVRQYAGQIAVRVPDPASSRLIRPKKSSRHSQGHSCVGLPSANTTAGRGL